MATGEPTFDKIHQLEAQKLAFSNFGFSTKLAGNY
jgi:hypothetical protein